METDKASARMRLHGLLRATAPEQRAAWSGQLRARLADAEQWKAARSVMLFAALRFEPDLLPLLGPGKRFAFPVLEEDRIVPREICTMEDFKVSPLGIREPDSERCPVAGDFDLVLVPGLGFGRDGSRLGRGRGHYDRFLAQLPGSTLLWGVCFACQVMDAMPSEGHDVKMQGVLTEQGLGAVP